jgi:hypothetical protein
MDNLAYLQRLSQRSPAGRAVTHNSVASQHLGPNGFRAWLTRPDDPEIEPCSRSWAAGLVRHFCVKS